MRGLHMLCTHFIYTLYYVHNALKMFGLGFRCVCMCTFVRCCLRNKIDAKLMSECQRSTGNTNGVLPFSRPSAESQTPEKQYHTDFCHLCDHHYHHHRRSRHSQHSKIRARHSIVCCNTLGISFDEAKSTYVPKLININPNRFRFGCLCAGRTTNGTIPPKV